VTKRSTNIRSVLIAGATSFFIWLCMQTFVLHRLGWSWPVSVYDAFVSSAVIAIACFITTLQYRYYQPGSGNRLYRLIFAGVITLIAGTVIRFTIEQLITEPGYEEFVEQSMPLRFILTFLLIAFVTILNWLIGNLRDITREEKKRNATEQLMRDAELARLRQQLQPHFIFNSLNSINALIGSDPVQARNMIHRLSSFLRGTLHKDEQKFVPVSKEVEHIQLYLDIEKVRFGNRLNAEFNMEADVAACTIPPLLLQPVIENAVKFGLYGTTDAVSIRIALTKANTDLLITVENPYEEDHVTGGTGFGLSSVSKRLQLLYGRNDLLKANASGKIFTVSLIIPQK
jgi:two-component system, LytTR family, sensor kinase